MADTIKVDPSPNRATIMGIVVPEKDGVFIITVDAKAEGNGHGTPIIWANIFIDGRLDKGTGEVGWKDGLGGVVLTTAEALKGGKDYEIMGMTGNRNAASVSIQMNIWRAG